MSTAQLAAVSLLARYGARTHALYAYQLRQWFAGCETNALDPLVSVVTHVALDHCDRLGNTLEAIGADKIHIARAAWPALGNRGSDYQV